MFKTLLNDFPAGFADLLIYTHCILITIRGFNNNLYIGNLLYASNTATCRQL